MEFLSLSRRRSSSRNETFLLGFCLTYVKILGRSHYWYRLPKFSRHFVQTSFRSIWNPCLWLATKQFWPISSICSPGLMKDRQPEKEVCHPVRQRRKFAKYSRCRKEVGLWTTITNWKWRKIWLRQLFQLKILRTGSLLCSWTNGIITLIVYLQRRNAPSSPKKCPVFNWNKGLFFYKQRSDTSHEKEQARYTLCVRRSISKDPT